MSTPAVRRAVADDVAVIGHLLYDFNTEYDEPTPVPCTKASASPTGKAAPTAQSVTTTNENSE